MNDEYTISNPPPGVWADFTYECDICGSSVRVYGSKELAHLCRIETDQ